MKPPREVAEEYMRESVAGCYSGDLDLLTSIIADVCNETLERAAVQADETLSVSGVPRSRIDACTTRIRALKGTNHGT